MTLIMAIGYLVLWVVATGLGILLSAWIFNDL